MLVLARKVGESIFIGNDVEVKILKIDGGEVKIGISAPKSVRILRKELYEEIMAENKKAIEFDIKDISEVSKFENR
ncbi:carbon storage regulator [Thermosipho melanesiensis]|uniref:Translational regulator CsrA n=2 Tax=Thermosipho melanesiensis TaxID=46541 RepID=CSRA_THEM4|nr:carbon storage regulator CsrA [Thermosipho melanesiensis]A6LJL9.1 RecName: Full=Translational regulator CsrA [Thermosipho melanesiensis BI429]ABR30120.1 carbon storage regulator, CsrA [Thermosipho melanesiensis BI429]APT73317.1 carbon storage regulator [Thermosipho melanesiensis]OOC38708.1 carbon storage regulator [Thermosipho melanesiensis]OOC40512.1 carbon storage regulator [Thermosipho melanesiensis]OOC40777.1 carbon storage regulator [Thermosipho melanesiensis]